MRYELPALLQQLHLGTFQKLRVTELHCLIATSLQGLSGRASLLQEENVVMSACQEQYIDGAKERKDRSDYCASKQERGVDMNVIHCSNSYFDLLRSRLECGNRHRQLR